MFTNLDFLKVGSIFPPVNEPYKARQENYISGRLLYDGNIEKVFKNVWSKIKTRFVNEYEMEQVLLKLNLFTPLTDTFELLAFQNDPEIWVGEGENAKKLDEISNFEEKKAIRLLSSAFISAHAQGTGVFKLYQKDGDFDISLVSPENWIPVYEENDLNTVKCHVVCETYNVNNTVTFMGVDLTSNTKRVLHVEVHYRGYYDNLLFELDNIDKRIKRLVKEERGIRTGLDNFAVYPFDFGKPTWRGWGASAYRDLIPVVEEMIVRASNDSKILDKHADPTLVAPAEAFEIDKHGRKRIRTGYALQMGRNGEKPEYVTWDGNLTASFKQFEDMLKLFYVISGTNPQLFGQDLAGNLSGEALQKVLIVPLSKTKKMLKQLEDTAEKVFTALMKLKGVNENVYVTFNTVNFVSASELADNMIKQKNAGIISTRTAIETLHPDWDKQDVESELGLIKEDMEQDSVMDIEDLYPNDVNNEQE